MILKAQNRVSGLNRIELSFALAQGLRQSDSSAQSAFDPHTEMATRYEISTLSGLVASVERLLEASDERIPQIGADLKGVDAALHSAVREGMIQQSSGSPVNVRGPVN